MRFKKIQNKTNQEIEKLEGMKNQEISIHYVNTRELLNWSKLKDIEEIFFYSIKCDIVNGSKDSEPKSVTECKNRHNWIKRKDII